MFTPNRKGHYVPLNCPALTYVDKPFPFDLGKADFHFDVHPVSEEALETTEVITYFAIRDPEGEGLAYFEVSPLITPAGSELSSRARHLFEREGHGCPTMGKMFRNRIASCPGIVDDVCWAAGGTALETVLEEVKQEP